MLYLLSYETSWIYCPENQIIGKSWDLGMKWNGIFFLIFHISSSRIYKLNKVNLTFKPGGKMNSEFGILDQFEKQSNMEGELLQEEPQGGLDFLNCTQTRPFSGHGGGLIC